MTVMFVHGGGEWAGSERVLHGLLGALDPARVRPVVAAMAEGRFVDDLEDSRVELHRLGPSPRLRRLAHLPTTIRSLRELARAVDADVLQADGEKMTVLAALAARRSRTPVVGWLHDDPARLLDPAGLATQTALKLVSTSSVVCPSQWLADAFRRRYQLAARCIPNGLTLHDLPAPSAGREALLAATGWSSDSTVVAFVGRLQRWKGPDQFLKAAAQVAGAAGGERARFVLLGGALFGREPDFAARLPDLARQLGIADRVEFLGHRHDVLELMSGADVVAHCSTRPEPFGMVVVEAMALGCAAVATRTGGPEEIVTDGVNGLLVRPGDPEALATALMRLVVSPALRTELATRARQTVADRYSAARMAEAFTDHWSGLVLQKASQP